MNALLTLVTLSAIHRPMIGKRQPINSVGYKNLSYRRETARQLGMSF